MDHIVYLNHKAKELDNLKSGLKSMIIRGAMGRKLPFGRVFKSDVLYFIENKGDGLIKGKAIVKSVFNSDKLSKEESNSIVNNNQPQLLLDSIMKKRFSGKRYLVLLDLKDFKTIEPFKIDRSAYSNMDDWLPVGDINSVTVK